MPEAERTLEDSSKELDALLSEARLREKEARKRAFWYTLLPIALGAIFLVVSLYEVSKLEKRSRELNAEIVSKSTELQQKTDEANKQEVLAKGAELRAREAQDKVDKALLALKTEGSPKDKATKALQILSKNVKEPEPVATQPAAENNKLISPGVEMVVVPNVLDLSFAQARQSLESYGLGYESVPEAERNIVIKQSPAAGTKTAKGGKVHLWFKSQSNPSSGFPRRP